MDTVYIETSIVSHATARPTSDLATTALQEQAKRWMAEQRQNYLIVTSQLVVTEATAGDAEAAARRLAAGWLGLSVLACPSRADNRRRLAHHWGTGSTPLPQPPSRWSSSEERTMPTNPILDELYAVRRQIMVEHGADLSAYLHAEFERLKASGHPIANIKQRTIRCHGAAKSRELSPANQSSPPGEPQR